MQVFEAGTIEIGYSTFGPTVGLYGTIRAKNKDVFVSYIELEVVRLRDGATHSFDWAFFRSNKIRLSQLSDVQLELASGFVLPTSQPRHYNIVFVDNETQEQLSAGLQPFAKEWSEYLVKRGPSESKESSNVHPSDQSRLVAYEEFVDKKIHQDTLTKVDRLRYWDPGKYSITMTTETADPNIDFSNSWDFQIDEANARLLSLNSLEILRGVCAPGTEKWNVANCQYDEGAQQAHNGQEEDAQRDI